MSDPDEYEASELDWELIREAAVKAARETPIRPAPALGYLRAEGWVSLGAPESPPLELVDVCGPHWLLDYAFHRIESEKSNYTEESYEQILYLLMPDGELRWIIFSDESEHGGEGGFAWFHRKHDHSSRPMTQGDIEEFDFERREGKWGRAWGTLFSRANGGRLLQVHKGDGLLLLLEKIRTGTAKQRETYSAPDADARYTLPALTEFHLTPDQRAEKLATVEEQRRKQEKRQDEQNRGKELRDKSKTIGKFRRLAGILAAISPIGVFFASLKMDPYPAVAALLSLPWVAIFCLSLVAWAVLRIVEPAVWNAGVSLDASNKPLQASLRSTYMQGRWKTSATAVLVAVLAIWLHSGRSTHPVPQNGARVEDRSESETQQGVQESAQLDTAGTDLGLAIPMSYPDCDDSGIVVIGNVTPPKERWRDAAAPIQRMLDDNPGASYLRTDHSCPSLRQADDKGNPIYAVYRPAGGTESEVCAEVRAAGGDAYGKWLSTSKPASYIIPC